MSEPKKRVAWKGEHLHVVVQPGYSYSGGPLAGTSYWPTTAEVLPVGVWKDHMSYSDSARIARRALGIDKGHGHKDGRYTKAAEAALVALAQAADPQWPAALASAREARAKIEAAEQAQRDVEYAARDADNKLRAAAPDLVEALREMVIANHGAPAHPNHEPDPVCRQALEQALAALAKAGVTL